MKRIILLLSLMLVASLVLVPPSVDAHGTCEVFGFYEENPSGTGTGNGYIDIQGPCATSMFAYLNGPPFVFLNPTYVITNPGVRIFANFLPANNPTPPQPGWSFVGNAGGGYFFEMACGIQDDGKTKCDVHSRY